MRTKKERKDTVWFVRTMKDGKHLKLDRLTADVDQEVYDCITMPAQRQRMPLHYIFMIRTSQILPESRKPNPLLACPDTSRAGADLVADENAH